MASRKGILNKSTMRAELTCQIRRYSSIDSLINASEIALKKFVEESEKVESGRMSPIESDAFGYLELYVKIASIIANFIHPRRTAIEAIQSDPTKDMTPEQRLEAMKHATLMLELQIKKNGPGTP